MNKVIPVCEPCRLEEKEKMSNRVKRRKKSKKKNRDPWADSSSDSDDLTDADRAWAKKLIPAIIKARASGQDIPAVGDASADTLPTYFDPFITFLAGHHLFRRRA